MYFNFNDLRILEVPKSRSKNLKKGFFNSKLGT